MWPHWGVLTVTVKAGCSIEVVSSVFGQLPVNFHAKWLLWHVQCAFRLRRLARNGVLRISVWHFPCKFPYKMALVKCPCACRLRRVYSSVSHPPNFPLIPWSTLFGVSCWDNFFGQKWGMLYARKCLSWLGGGRISNNEVFGRYQIFK